MCSTGNPYLVFLELLGSECGDLRSMIGSRRRIGLIRLELAVQEGKIGGTTRMLAALLDPNKPKLFDQMRDVMRTTRSS